MNPILIDISGLTNPEMYELREAIKGAPRPPARPVVVGPFIPLVDLTGEEGVQTYLRRLAGGRP